MPKQTEGDSWRHRLLYP